MVLSRSLLMKWFRMRHRLRTPAWRLALAATLGALVVAGLLSAAWLRVGGLRLPGSNLSSPAPVETSGSEQPRAGEHGAALTDVLRIAFVGASVTRGWFATSTTRAFPERSAAILPTQGRDVLWTVLAEPGAPVDVAERWRFPRHQDIVVVHVVSDDFLYGTPLQEYARRYDVLLRRILRASPKAHLMCLGDWGRIGAIDQAGIVAYSYDSAVHASCDSDGGTYVPINQLYDVPGARGPAGRLTPFGISDAVHPNDLGHNLIGQTVVQGLEGHVPAEPVPPPGAASKAPVLPRPTPGTPPQRRSGRTKQ